MDYCNVYINEMSLVGQCADSVSVEDAIGSLLDCLSVFDGCDSQLVKVQKYYYGGLYVAPISYGISLQNLGNKDLKRKFRLALRDAVNWDNSPLTQLGAVYLYKGKDVSWSSMSEAYENTYSFLVNLQGVIDEPFALVEKNGSSNVEVSSFSDSSTVIKEVIKSGWRQQTYNLSSCVPPRDEESILADLGKFEPTEHRYNGRLMYRRIGTNHLCYIDSKHFGAAAHIEEFNEATKKPVQTLNINVDSVHHELTPNERRRTLRSDNE